MKLRLVLFFTLVAIATHFYLTNHYYELSLGLSAGDAACNINQLFNCDSATASSYAQLLGIPIAAWGLGTNLVFLMLVFAWMIGWTENLQFHAKFTFALASFIALASVVMGGISVVFLGQYCLFCMLTYLMSFINFELIRRSANELETDTKDASGFSELKKIFQMDYLKVYGGILLAIPVSALLLNKGVLNHYGAKNIQEMVAYSIADWKAAKELNFDVEPSFKSGPDNAKFIIYEFADFRCGHCKHAAPSISAFIKSHPDTQLRFYSFPLDGVCNEGIPPNGSSCLLATAALCAETQAGKGYSMHDKIFAAQDEFMSTSLDKMKSRLTDFAKDLEMDTASFESCFNSEEALNSIKEQARLGQRVNVRGTPTFFANGKKLPRAQSLSVLKKAYESVK